MLKKYALPKFDYSRVVLDVDKVQDSLVVLLEVAAKTKMMENLSDAVGLSRPTLLSYLRGEYSPRLNDAVKIFKYYGFSLKVSPTENQEEI